MEDHAEDPTEDPQRLGLGGNYPPAPTTCEVLGERIDGLYDEAKLWLDGAVIDTPELADGVVTLLTALRAVKAEAEAAREEAKRPYLTAGRAVDAAWKPVIAKAVQAMDTCKVAIKPWLVRLEREGEARAQALAEQADAAIERARAM